ncbi:MAG: hypothetical protein ABIJ65_07815, partial [Chloroflexota bacterium]
HNLAEHEHETAIITMLLDDYYQQMLHMPTPQPETAKPPDPAKPTALITGRKKLGWNRRGRN